MSDVKERRAKFRALHQKGCFVLPNPWDAGTARLLQDLGFAAIASTSSGYAWTMGRPDYAVTKENVLTHLKNLCEAVDLPVNADFESGFAADPEGIAANVIEAIGTGIAGVSIEDRKIGDLTNLYDHKESVERIKAARKAIDQSGTDVILVARTESLLIDRSAIRPAIDKLVAMADAGADCLYAPGVLKKTDIEAMVKAVAPKPVNVLAMGPGVSLQEFTDLGVRRVSVGGSLARTAWGTVMNAAQALKAGKFEGLVGGASGAELNKIFGRFS